MPTVVSRRPSKLHLETYELPPVDRNAKILTKKHDSWSVEEDIRLVSYCK
jgi:hypothetical protein